MPSVNWVIVYYHHAKREEFAFLVILDEEQMLSKNKAKKQLISKLQHRGANRYTSVMSRVVSFYKQP